MNDESLPVTLILASSSKYRKMLLQRFALPFECHVPEIDESANFDESPRELVSRLAIQKAEDVSAKYPRAVVIGSDQVALLDGQVLGKPGDYQAAMEQLKSFSKRTVEFLTAVSVQCRQTGFSEQHTDETRVSFRALDNEEIKRYLEKEQPYDCAGGFKAESLGIVLFEQIASRDPSALIGLPLIHTAAMLRRAGLKLP